MDRPGLQEMLSDAKSENYDILFVESGHMLSRNTEDTLQIFEILKNNNITLMSVEQKQLVEIKHDDGRYVLDSECHYRTLESDTVE